VTTVEVDHKTPAGVDGNGDPVASTTTTTTLTGVTMEPLDPTEADAVRDGAVVQYRLRCPIDAAIARGDTARWRDQEFRVHTVPKIWEDPWSGSKVEGLEVFLRRVEVDR
jgi:hypothetical protein